MATNKLKEKLTACKVYTTGQVSVMLAVSARTVQNMCDEGRLGHFLIPGSQDRRIPHTELERFCREYGFPVDGLRQTARQVVLAGVPESLADQVQRLGSFSAYQRVQTLLTLGLAITASVDVVVIDTSLGRCEALDAGRTLREMLPRAKLVLLVAEDVGTPNGEASAFNSVLSQPVNPSVLLREITGTKE